MGHTEITRRSFIKAAAATGAALAAAGHVNLVAAHEAYAADSTGTVQVVNTVCRACIAQCTMLAHIRDGRVIKLEGDPDGPLSRGTSCAKGLAATQALYNPMRNKYPMIRVGERGSNNFKRISWNEALDTIADKLMEVRDKYGAETVFAGTGGGGNPHSSGPVRFTQAFGSPNTIEPGSSQCYLPRQTACQLVRGPSYVFADLQFCRANSDLFYPDGCEAESLVIWGCNPNWSSPGMNGQAVSALEARPQGLKLVVIDPRFTPEASKAEVWLPIRPGTDVALMMCWMSYIIENELYDKEFCQKWTNYPFLVNPESKLCFRANEVFPDGSPTEYVVWDKKTNSAKPMPYPYDENLDAELFGTYQVNGISCKTGYQILKEACEEFTLEKTAEICWLDADEIKRAIHVFTDTISTINHGVATDQSPNASSAAMGAMMLEAMLGHYECPGAMSQRFGDLTKNPGLCSDDTFGLGNLDGLATQEVLEKRIGAREYKGLHKWHQAHVPTMLDAILTGVPYKPRVWLERSGNKFAMLANPQGWHKAVSEIEFIVHACLYPTSFTVEAADVVLPMREWLETPRPVLLANKIFVRRETTHLFETMDETVMWGKLARKCADRGHELCQKAFDAKAVAPEIPLTDTQEEVCQSYMKTCEISFKELLEKAPYEYTSFEEWKQYYVYKAPDPKTGLPRGFNTPSKIIEAYCEGNIILGRTGKPFSVTDKGKVDLLPASHDYSPIPYYVEPEESPYTETDYPLIMTSGRVPLYHHGTLRNVPWLREIMPCAEIWIWPEDAEQYGIKDRDWVKVESKRGECFAMAHVTKGIRPGVVYMERFWNPELLESDARGSWTYQNVNMCSKGDGTFDEVHGTYTLRGYQVKVSKADSVPAGVWLDPKDFTPWLPEPSDRTEEVK